MDRTLSRNLHKLTARLDQATDRLLRTKAGISYARFLALHTLVRKGRTPSARWPSGWG